MARRSGAAHIFRRHRNTAASHREVARIFRDADTRYVVSFDREKTILQAIFTDRMPLPKRIVARLIGFDGAYHRFTGKVTIEKFEGGACGAFRRSCGLGTDEFR
jgi:hypothetical protein